jgi:hypothetical protein
LQALEEPRPAATSSDPGFEGLEGRRGR